MTKFKDTKKIYILEAKKIFSTGLDDEICDALLSVTLYDNDWKWVQTQCLHFLNHTNYNVSGLAATCLGHLARIHNKLDRELVVASLKSRLKDEKISGQIQDALDDIDMFLF